MEYRLRVLVLVGTVLVLAMGCTSAESYARQGYDFGQVDKVAVVNVRGDLAGKAVRQQIFDYIAMELMKKGHTVIEREQMQSILEEQKFQRSDITTSQEAAMAGRVLNVPAVVMAAVNVRGERVTMTLKMVEVETAALLWTGTASGTTGRVLSTVGGAVVGAAGGVALGGDETGKIAGGVLGGALGGAAGHQLAPSEDRVIRKLLRKVFKTLPQK